MRLLQTIITNTRFNFFIELETSGANGNHESYVVSSLTHLAATFQALFRWATQHHK